jgi:hypothetical protein
MNIRTFHFRTFDRSIVSESEAYRHRERGLDPSRTADPRFADSPTAGPIVAPIGRDGRRSLVVSVKLNDRSKPLPPYLDPTDSERESAMAAPLSEKHT